METFEIKPFDERSYLIGKQEGRREVVEWIQTHPGKDKHTWDEWFEWQAKLKEWELNID